MKNLTTLPGAPDSRTITLGTVDDGLFPILSPQSDVSVLAISTYDNTQLIILLFQNESPFNAPPFVTAQELKDHKADSGISEGFAFQPSRTG